MVRQQVFSWKMQSINIWGPLKVLGCLTSPGAGADSGLHVRQATGGRRMTGHEAVSCTVTAPNGTVHAVPVVLADGGGHFQATLHWMQVGVHKVLPALFTLVTAPKYSSDTFQLLFFLDSLWSHPASARSHAISFLGYFLAQEACETQFDEGLAARHKVCERINKFQN